ncbi:MAG: AbrB/MazE/SpoVT family DNA-binding domain-containing protein [Pseudomonadota bacterium]|nr:AbrB/MazE/SpoVT family DNA-binding domain-containing protein [Pseudomonadota bacterium]
MSESTISSKGQVTIPKAIRTRMRLKVGDRLRFVVEADGSVRLAAATRDISTLRDILPSPNRRANVNEMQAAIRKRAAKRARP